MEPNAELARPIGMTLVLRYALTRLRARYAHTMAGRGPGTPTTPELDQRITEALRNSPPPRRTLD